MGGIVSSLLKRSVGGDSYRRFERKTFSEKPRIIGDGSRLLQLFADIFDFSNGLLTWFGFGLEPEWEFLVFALDGDCSR